MLVKSKRPYFVYGFVVYDAHKQLRHGAFYTVVVASLNFVHTKLDSFRWHSLC